MRVGVTLAVVGAIVGEWAGAERGLGVLVNLARGILFDTPLMFATLLTIAMLGIVLYLVVVAIERRAGRRAMNQPMNPEVLVSSRHAVPFPPCRPGLVAVFLAAACSGGAASPSCRPCADGVAGSRRRVALGAPIGG